MPRKKQRVSLRDVAARAGVSPTTVSFVNRGRPGVAPETVALVRRAMEELGYVPSPRSVGVGNGVEEPAKVIFALPGGIAYVSTARIYQRVVEGAEAAAAGLGLDFSVHGLAEPSPDGVRELLESTGADGGIVLGNDEQKQAFAAGVPDGFPLVAVMGLDCGIPGCDHVTYDDAEVGRLAARLLLERGHRTVAVFGQFMERTDAFLETARCAGADAHLLHGGGSIEFLVHRAMALSPRPTGFFCTAMASVPSAALFFEERGWELWRDYELVSCDNIAAFLELLDVKPPSIDIHPEQVGSMAVERVLSRLRLPGQARVVSRVTPEMVLHDMPPAWRGAEPDARKES